MISLDKTSKDQDLVVVNNQLLASPLKLANCFGRLSSTPTNTDLCLYKQFVFNESALKIDETLGTASPSRQLEFLMGRRVAGLALSDLDARLGHTVLSRQERGVAWPAGVCGSISHKNEWAWAVVAKTQHYRSIGIDLEPILTQKSEAAVTRHSLGDAEREFAATLDERARRIFKTLIFSGKESLFKCLAPITKKFHSFQSAAFVDLENLFISSAHDLGTEQGLFQIQLTEDWSNEFTKDMIFSGHWCIQSDMIFSAVLLQNSPT